MKQIFIAALIAGLFQSYTFAQKNEQLALTPPMGWNSWNKFECDVNEKLIRQMADEFVSSGMKNAGYQYIIIDDCWQGKRDSLGFIHPDATRFPSGMKALADYIHDKGLKFGIYSDAGYFTCGGRPGSHGHEYQDAITYAKWGVDYLKYDWCNTRGFNPKVAYTTISDAIRETGRPIVLSICEWGMHKPWEWAKESGHLWRTTGDIINAWDSIKVMGNWRGFGVMQILDMQKNLRKYSGPSHWNDPDMLEVGNGMQTTEDRAHFSLWCMLAAPLIAGNDLRIMSKETVEILTNSKAIAINQDALGIQAYLADSIDNIETWIKPLSGNEVAICFLNRSMQPVKIEYDWKAKPIADELSKTYIDFNKTIYTVSDIWKPGYSNDTKKSLNTIIPAHDVLMLRLSKK